MAVGCDIGVAGIEVHPGAHICGLYRGAVERDAIVVGFLNAGLAAATSASVSSTPASPRRSSPPWTPGWLPVSAPTTSSSTSFGRRTCTSDPAGSLPTRPSARGRRPSLRSCTTVDSTWPGGGDLVAADVVPDAWELRRSRLRDEPVPAAFPRLILCLYDLERFGGGFGRRPAPHPPQGAGRKDGGSRTRTTSADEFLAGSAQAGRRGPPRDSAELAARVAS